MLDSRYVFAGRDWELLEFALTNGSRTSFVGAPPSNDGREEDEWRTWPSCGLYDGFGETEPVCTVNPASGRRNWPLELLAS